MSVTVATPAILTPLQLHDALEVMAKELRGLRDGAPPSLRRPLERLEAKARYLSKAATELLPRQVPAVPVDHRSPVHRPANWHKKNRDGQRQCAGCREWLPVEDYDPKSPAGTLLRSHCRTCWKAYQRQRYVAANKRAIIIDVLDGDEIVGVECACCRKPINIGDRVAAELFRHADCLADE